MTKNNLPQKRSKRDKQVQKKDKIVEKKLERVLEEQRHVSTKISELCRYIGFGVVAVNYAVFTSNSQFSIELLATYKIYLLISASFAVLTILFDYLQFLLGYISVRDAIKNTKNGHKYNKNSFFYKGRFRMFCGKQIANVLSVVVLLYVMFSKLIS